MIELLERRAMLSGSGNSDDAIDYSQATKLVISLQVNLSGDDPASANGSDAPPPADEGGGGGLGGGPLASEPSEDYPAIPPEPDDPEDFWDLDYDPSTGELRLERKLPDNDSPGLLQLDLELYARPNENAPGAPQPGDLPSGDPSEPPPAQPGEGGLIITIPDVGGGIDFGGEANVAPGDDDLFEGFLRPFIDIPLPDIFGNGDPGGIEFFLNRPFDGNGDVMGIIIDPPRLFGVPMPKPGVEYRPDALDDDELRGTLQWQFTF